VVALAVTVIWPGILFARAQAQAPQPSNFSRTSASGSFLAARHAGGQKDAAAAASYYRAALRGDPRNNELLGRTFLAVLANGEVDALRYGRVLRARRLVDVAGVGQTYNGIYYVQQVTHNIRRVPRGQYTQSFTLQRDGRGASGTSVEPGTS